MGKDKYNPWRQRPILKAQAPVVNLREVIPRSAWRAEPPHPLFPLERTSLPVEHVVFTYSTMSDRCHDRESCVKALRSIQQYHMTRGLPDIPYNFLVGGDLKIYEGRGWDFKPERHDMFPEIYDNSIEIAFIGNYIEEGLSEMSQLIVEAFHAVDIGIQAKNVTESFKLKESSSKFRLETLGADERGRAQNVPYPKGYIDLVEPNIVKNAF